MLRSIFFNRYCTTVNASHGMSRAVRELCAIADIGNEAMQRRKPWDELKTDPEQARLTCTFALNICEVLANYLAPITPEFASQGAAILGVPLKGMKASQWFGLRKQPLGEMQRLFERIDRDAVDKLIEASKSE